MYVSLNKTQCCQTFCGFTVCNICDALYCRMMVTSLPTLAPEGGTFPETRGLPSNHVTKHSHIWTGTLMKREHILSRLLRGRILWAVSFCCYQVFNVQFIWFWSGRWLSTAMFLSMTKMGPRQRIGRLASRSELCAAARVASTVNTRQRKETDMMAYIR